MHIVAIYSSGNQRVLNFGKKNRRKQIRDERNIQACENLGWKVLVIWECALKGKTRRNLNEIIHTAANWLLYDSQSAEISGKNL